MGIHLAPAQESALEKLRHALPLGSIFVIWGRAGMGRTTVLREAHRESGGAFLTIRDLVDASQSRHPLALEDAFQAMVMAALADNDVVFVDDLHLLNQVVGTCAGFYPRQGYLNAALAAIAAYATEAGKKLVFGDEQAAPPPIHERCFYCGIEDLRPPDYEAICRPYLEPAVAQALDYDRIWRFTPHLNAHQLKAACLWFTGEPKADTDRFIEYLRTHRMASNVDLGEVQDVDLADLKGVDDVLSSLEAGIIVPLENADLAEELGLQPKRGVLLVGEPGTGKTTVGRALAHRLKSKFFLIDGTFIAGTPHFFERVHQVFQAAEQNAPCIIFIDDSDAIFESGQEFGLYRYLLSMLGAWRARAATACA